MTALPPPLTYNILFLGETQSGKSTLIEHFKKYADADYVVNREKIGDSISSLTNDVISSKIETSSPVYFISSLRTRERVDYGRFIEEIEQEDYEDQLNARKGYLLEREKLSAAKVTFNLIDTPGLNDTSLFDETNIAIIFKALEAIESVNLVVITVSNNPFTEGLMAALKAYVELLPEFNGNLVFVHTRTDYAKLHPEDDSSFAQSLNEKKKILAEIVGRDSVPHILIDNDIGTKRVVRDCITQNTLRNLLNMAKLNQPIPIRTMRMNKTEKMRHVDLILRDKYEARVRARLETLSTKDEKQHEIMSRINLTKGIILKKKAYLKEAREYLRVHDNDILELLHEELYQQDFTILNLIERAAPMYYPGKKRSREPGFMHHVLDHLDIRTQNIKVLQEAGGKGELSWAVKFRRRKRQNGIYHVKIYITRKKKFAEAIENKKTAVKKCEVELDDHRADLEEFERDNQKQQDEIKELLDDLKLDLYLLNRVVGIQLDSNIFHILVDDSVYVRDLAESARNVESFYIERREQLEAWDKDIVDFVVARPVNSSDTFDDAGSDIGEGLEISHPEFESEVQNVEAAALNALANVERIKHQDKGSKNRT